jgi:Tol biopolymer transport system component
MSKTFAVAFGALIVLGLATVALADQTINWVSVSADGTVNGSSGPVAVSDDGRFVAIRSSAALAPGSSAGTDDVFVKDMQTGTVEIVSVSSGGTQGNGASGAQLGISDDGRYVVFTSGANNLVPADTNNASDVFIHDRQTDETTRIPRNDGQQGASAGDGAISGDGRYVVLAGTGFEASAPATSGLFVFDRVAGTTERVTDGVVFLDHVAEDVAISDDGRHVAFTTREFNGNEDVILYDRQTDTWEVANPRLGNAAPITRQNNVSISGNGRFVAFGSPDTNYVAGDPASTFDVFVYDSNPETLERIPAGGTTGTNWTQPVISDDGRHVAFNGYGDLYGAANGVQDVVLYDRQTDSGVVVSVHDDGSSSDRASGSFLQQPTISGDGRFIAFTADANFDAADPGAFDVYIVDREGVLGPPPGGACTHDFTDVDSSNIFEASICWLAEEGITLGCNPPVNDRFCPTGFVTRGQMAAFLVRALGYADDGGGDLFVDDDDSVFELAIDRLRTAGVTLGCNPPVNDRFCPDDRVTRGQMAAFLVRALGYADDGGGDLFVDDDNSVFELAIDRLGTARVTLGCNPPVNDRFCPNDNVTRQQMAAFLKRALGG